MIFVSLNLIGFALAMTTGDRENIESEKNAVGHVHSQRVFSDPDLNFQYIRSSV